MEHSHYEKTYNKDKQSEATNPTEKKDLLDRIARCCGCLYISDIKRMQPKEILTNMKGNIEIETYTLADWIEAITYITGTPLQLDTMQSVRDYLHKIEA